MLARMKHPNIVRYHDCFMDPNYLIILMEHCNAGDLAGLIKKQAGQLLPEQHVMFLFVQVGLPASGGLNSSARHAAAAAGNAQSCPEASCSHAPHICCARRSAWPCTMCTLLGCCIVTSRPPTS